MRFPRAKTLLLAAGISALASGYATACRFDDSNFYFQSEDMSVVNVKVAGELPPHQFIMMKIPRAYITFASKYTGKVQTVPDQIETNNLQIRLTLPEGKALNGRVNELSKNKYDCAEIRRSLRPVVAHVEIWSSSKSVKFPERWLQFMKLHRLVESNDDYDLYHFGPHNQPTYILKKSKLLGRIICGSGSKPHPTHFCTYDIIAGKGFVMRADFLDFRVNGGLQFALDRAQALRDIVCTRFVECEQ